MNALKASPQIRQIMQQLDHLIAEMTTLRHQVAALGGVSVDHTTMPPTSVRQSAYFGMWADREDMQDRSSREWLDDLRRRQWLR